MKNLAGAEEETPLNPKPQSRKRLVHALSPSRSIYIMLFVNFLSSVCFSIVLPTIWFFIEEVDTKASNTTGVAQLSLSGWVVAVNSFGTFVGSPLFGWWFDRSGARMPLFFSLFVMIAGNIYYSMAQDIWMLLTARFIVGVAAANYALAQAYLSYATTEDDRTKIMAYNSATTVMGFIFGPAFSAALSFIPPDALRIASWYVLNPNRTPGVLAAILCLPALFATFSLQEIPPGERAKAKDQQKGETGTAGAPALTGSVSNYNFTGSTPRYNYSGTGLATGGSIKDLSNIFKASKHPEIPWLPVLICLYAYFAYTLSFTVWETLGTPYTAKDFHWTSFKTSLLFGGLGVLCILSLMLLQVLTWYISDRPLLLGSTVLTCAGYATMISPYKMLEMDQFFVSAALASVGYATSVAVLISIYSKVLGDVEQGMLMGWLSSAGSMARIAGPIFAAYTWAEEPCIKSAATNCTDDSDSDFKPTGYLVFSITLAMLVACLVLISCCYGPLSPRRPTLLGNVQ